MKEPEDLYEFDNSLIARSTTPRGKSQEHVFPDTIGSGEMVKWATGATGTTEEELASTQFIEVVTETVERTRGLGCEFKFSVKLPEPIGGGVEFEKKAWKVTKTTTKRIRRINLGVKGEGK